MRDIARQHDDSDSSGMPTLFRLITVVAVIGGLGFGMLWVLANFFEPEPRPMTITIPQDRIGK